MSPGPLRRLLGALGLVALAPIALRLVDGSMSPADAAVRAVMTLLAVVVLGRLLGTWLRQVAATYDRRDPAGGPTFDHAAARGGDTLADDGH